MAGLSHSVNLYHMATSHLRVAAKSVVCAILYRCLAYGNKYRDKQHTFGF